MYDKLQCKCTYSAHKTAQRHRFNPATPAVHHSLVTSHPISTSSSSPSSLLPTLTYPISLNQTTDVAIKNTTTLVGFGFSVGDFTSTVSLVATVIDALRESGGSSSEYRALVIQVETIKGALLRVQDLEVDDSQQRGLVIAL
jgi:hypothetical protein